MKFRALLEPIALRLGSVRTRLMLWNVCALALILCAFGGLLQWVVKINLLRSVDRELASRPFPLLRRFHDKPPPGPPPGPMPHGPDDTDFDPLSFIDKYLQSSRETPGRVTYGQEQAASKTDALIRPKLFDTTGKSLGPAPEEQVWDRRAFARSLAGEETYSTILYNNEPLRVYSAPIRRRGQIIAVVQAAHPLSDVNRAVADVNRTLLALIPVALLLAGVGGAFLTNQALRPVKQIADAAQEIGAQDLSRRLAIVGRDEFSHLATTFNAMLARLGDSFRQKEELVRELERMVEQQRRFTSDASHELRTPLTVIKANTSLSLRHNSDEAELREAMEDIDRAADAMSRLVKDLLLLSRADAAQLARHRTPLRIHPILARAAADTAYAGSAPIRLDVADPALCVLGDFDEILRLFTNLIENAVRYTPGDGRITVSAEALDDHVRVTVADSGIGIAPEHLPHVCERFYRVDAARTRAEGGAGLGLAICKSVVEAHRGELRIESVARRGTTVIAILPRADDRNDNPEAIERLTAASNG
jgi:signal transduction histidine kinase